MAMKRQSGKIDLDRRSVLTLALAGALALVLGRARGVLAAEKKKEVEIKVLKESESVIPGFAKIRLAEAIFPPGSSIKGKMENAMVCELTSGSSFEDIIDGKKSVRKKGDIWTCKTGQAFETTNKGKTVAVMRYYDLLPA